MKILFLTKKLPFKKNDGESLAISSIAKSLHRSGAEISLLGFNTTKHHLSKNEIVKPEYFSSIEYIELDNRVKPIPLLKDLILNRSYNISRFKSDAFKSKLIKLLKENRYDVVQIESLYMVPYIATIRQFSEAKIVMRSHNVEYIIWEKLCTNENNLLKRWYFKKCATLLKSYEIQSLKLYDLLVPISTVDEKKFKNIYPDISVLTIPMGIDVNEYEVKKTDKPSLFFIGSLDWLPNVNGLKWFLDHVWSSVRKTYPDLVLHIAGRNSGDALLAYRSMKNVIFHGEVESAMGYMQSYDMMIVPLFSGSGMRIKVVEGMALGKCIISTSIGAEGIPYTQNYDIAIADSTDEFLDQISRLIEGPKEKEGICSNARKLIETHFGIDALGERLFKKYKSLL